MRVNITPRICVIDGWIVDTERRCLVTKMEVRRDALLSEDDILELSNVETVDMDLLSDDKNQLVELEPHSELFDVIPRKWYKFYVRSDGIATVILEDDLISSSRKAKKHIQRYCYQFEFKENHVIFLTCREENISASSDMLNLDSAIAKTANLKMFNAIVQVPNLVFTDEDFKVLKRFDGPLIDNFRYFGQTLLSEAYKILKQNSHRYIGKKGYHEVSSTIKQYDPLMVITYGRRLAPYLFTMCSGPVLSIFSNDQFIQDTNMLLLGDTRNIHRTIQILSNAIAHTIFSNKYDTFFTKWIRLGELDIQHWNNIANQPYGKPAVQYLQDLDALRCFLDVLTFCDTSVAADLSNAIRTDDPTRFPEKLRVIYAATLTEAGALTAQNVRYDPVHNYARISNKRLSLDMIIQTRRTLQTIFKGCTTILSEFLEFGMPEDVYRETMGNRNFEISGRNMTDDPSLSIFDSMSQVHFQPWRMRRNKRICKNTIDLRRDISKIYDHITKLLMMIMFFSTGIPMRYPELSTITFAGLNRNLFIDKEDRVFFLKTYFEGDDQKMQHKFLFLDSDTSAYLLWYLYILRPFIMELTGDALQNFKKGGFLHHLINELEVEGNEEILFTTKSNQNFFSRMRRIDSSIRDSTNGGLTVMRMFLFVDIKAMSFIPSWRINKLIANLPCKHKKDGIYTIGVLEKAMLVLWKHFFAPAMNVNTTLQRIISSYLDEQIMAQRNVPDTYLIRDLSTTNDNFNYYIKRDHNVSTDSLNYYTMKELCNSYNKITAEGPRQPGATETEELTHFLDLSVTSQGTSEVSQIEQNENFQNNRTLNDRYFIDANSFNFSELPRANKRRRTTPSSNSDADGKDTSSYAAISAVGSTITDADGSLTPLNDVPQSKTDEQLPNHSERRSDSESNRILLESAEKDTPTVTEVDIHNEGDSSATNDGDFDKEQPEGLSINEDSQLPQKPTETPSGSTECSTVPSKSTAAMSDQGIDKNNTVGEISHPQVNENNDSSEHLLDAFIPTRTTETTKSPDQARNTQNTPVEEYSDHDKAGNNDEEDSDLEIIMEQPVSRNSTSEKGTTSQEDGSNSENTVDNTATVEHSQETAEPSSELSPDKSETSVDNEREKTSNNVSSPKKPHDEKKAHPGKLKYSDYLARIKRKPETSKPTVIKEAPENTGVKKNITKLAIDKFKAIEAKKALDAIALANSVKKIKQEPK